VLHYDLDGDGKADYSVKIDEFPEQQDGYDLDSVLGGLRSFVADANDVIDGDSVLLGVSIKGGRKETQYFAVEGNKNGAEPDPGVAPANLRNTGPGTDDALFYEDFVRAFGSIDDAPRDAAEDADPEEPEVEPA
jgi:hypothetical protein